MAFNLFEKILGTKQDPTQGLMYKTLSKFEPQANMATEALKDTTKMYEQKAQNISQWGKNTANAPGYVALGEALKRTFPKYADRDSAELGKSAIEKFPDNQEYRKVIESQGTLLGYGAKVVGGIGSMAVSAPGMVTGGTEQLGTGIGTIASAQSGQDIVEGGLQALKGATTAGFGVATGAMPVASTLFGAATGFEPVQNALGYAGKKAGDISAGTAKFLGGNEQVQEQARQLGEIALPAVALKGLSVGGKYAKPVTQATGKAIVKGAEVVAPKVVEFGRQTGKQISKIGDDVRNMYSESISGLNKSEQAGIQANPYQQKDFAEMVQRTKSSEGIDDIKNYQTEQYGKVTEQVTKTLDDMQKNFSEDGKVYQEIKGLPTRVQSQPILQSIEAHPLLAMDETGRIVRKPGIESGTITDSDISQINRLYQDIRASVESGNGTLSVEQLLKSRSTASKYARYDKMDVNTLSADGAKIMRDIRGSLDRVAKEQVPGLKELDSLYVDKMTELNDALRDLIYKGGDVKGEYRSNLGSIISNLANPSRANLLARLEQIIPGIGQKVESIRNLATLHKTMNDKGIFARYSGAGGAVVGATTLGTAFPVVGHIVGFLGGGLLGRLIEGGVTKGKVRILEKILSKETPARQAEIGKIAKAVEEGKKLDAQGKKIIEEIKAKIIYEKARATVQPDDSKLLLPSPSGKATGAKNFRVNQPFEKNPEPSIMGKQEGKRVIVKTPESQKLLTAPKLPKGTSYPRTDVSAQSMQGLSSNVKRPNGSTSNNNPVSTRAGAVRQKVTPQKTVVKPKETNITRNEKIEKGFSDSAKARWDKGEFTSTERGNAIKYLKSNYKGKEYTIDGKKYKVDAIDNRNEQVRLVDSEGNIKRVRINNLPETKVNDKDIFDYYNQREQKGYKTVIVPKGQTPAGPTTFNTSGKKIIKKAPESPVAMEKGYTTAIRKPIVKRSADVESGLKKPKGMKIYDEIVKNNKDITSVSFDDFYTFAKYSKMKGMTKDKAWQTWGNAVIKKIEKGESPNLEILKKTPLIGVMIKDYLKKRINPFDL